MDNEEKIDTLTQKIGDCLNILGLDTNSEGLKDTPRRIAKMWVNDLCKNSNTGKLDLKKSMTLFTNESANDNLIIVKDIKFNSWCMHHFLPFSGVVSVGYVPNKSIIGLSKIPRVVKYFSKKPQIQEKLGEEIAHFLFDTLDPKCIVVQVVATHTCVACRGAESDCATDTLHTINGSLSEKHFEKLKKEFLERVR